jgi:(E)-4-hydroxy-3-methylbut-2-enyl-diphosphate synthase
VSLTEDPEFEAPVARSLITKSADFREKASLGIKKNNSAFSTNNSEISAVSPINPYTYSRRGTFEVGNFGALNVPRVIADFSKIDVESHDDLKPIGHFYLPLPDKWRMNDLGADYIYSGKKSVPFMLPNGLKEILDYEIWQSQSDLQNKLPLFTVEEFFNPAKQLHQTINFVEVSLDELTPAFVEHIKEYKNTVILAKAKESAAMVELRSFYFQILKFSIKNPVVLSKDYEAISESDFQLFAATDFGGVLIEGYGDGIMVGLPNLDDKTEKLERLKTVNSTSM